ncbi:hypothetical protein RB195_019860 [Necator americanus]|uniref:Phosphodeoxyriboaldolase n=1 Tax=Necator americanus TaxID=51031 RepID=A0ABR1CIB6_NECAM
MFCWLFSFENDMITVPFSIHELCDSGEERLLSCNDVCEKVASFKEVFRGIDAKLVALHMPRSSELVCAVAALVDIHTPFLILQPGDNPVSLRAHFLFDGKELVEINSLHECTSDEAEEQDFCYFISTSGTTGSAKLVGVPYSCIGPNIEDFSERFSITSDDLVLCSTSFCFDPSIVELFLTFTSGAQLLLVPDRIRSQPHLFSNVLKTYTPTFVQLTPSVLSLFDESTLSWIFSDHSLIRCLLIGGEKFPYKLVQRFRTLSNPTRIFNVYGVTEVSCWATAAEITFNCNFVDIGSPLKCTTLSLTPASELLIGGTRRCRVNGVWGGEFTATGDIVDVVDGKYVVVGRTDDQIKLNGIRCNLAALSEIQIMSSSFIPSKVIYLDRVPLTPSGKVDRLKLTLMLEEQCSAQMKSWSDIFKFLEKFGIRHTPDLSFQSFVNYAAEIALHFGTVDALRDILDPNMAILDVLRKYTCQPTITNSSKSIGCSDVVIDVSVILSLQPDISWACDTKKCIDGTPLLTKLFDEDVVAACSHSGVVVCLRLRDGFCLWKTRIHCRFETSPTRTGDYIVVGGYDGGVYFLSANTGVTEWRFGCAYDRKLYKLDPKQRECVWSCPIRSGSPARAVVLKECVFVTTIKGSLEAINMERGMLLWLYQTQAPIFSSLAIFCESGFISSVDGVVTKIRLNDGKKEVAANTHEPIFARVSIFCNLVHIVTQSGSLFLADLMLHILRSFRFASCSFVVPPRTVRDNAARVRILQEFMGAFSQAEFDKEVSRDFNTQEISSAIARYEKEAAALLKDKAQVRKVISYIDLTTLSGDDTKGRVVALVDRALNPIPDDSSVTCAAVCVYPQRVADVTKHLTAKQKTLNVASVAAGFPSGQYHLQSKLLEVQLTVADGATEIDIVISRAAALEGDWKTVHDEVAALKGVCGNAHMKTILATGELKTLTNIYKGSWASILAGSDFIKTSTGKECTNATLEVAYVMCLAIKRWYKLTGKKVGFKPAGGIKTPEEALAYIVLVKDVLGESWLSPELFRIGASSLLDNCLKAI